MWDVVIWQCVEEVSVGETLRWCHFGDGGIGHKIVMCEDDESPDI